MTDGLCTVQNMLELFRFVHIPTLFIKPFNRSKFNNQFSVNNKILSPFIIEVTNNTKQVTRYEIT
jgi:hypothetical protein